MQYFKGRSLEDYLGFIRPCTKMRCLFYLTQSISNKDIAFSKDAVHLLKYADQKRREAQIKIGKINACVAQICTDCKGQCCRGSYDHYSSLDYFIRLYGDYPIISYGCEDKNSINRIFIIADRMQRIMKNKDVLFTGQNRTGCHLLGPSGCTAEVELRPIKCMTFTCVRMRNTMTKNMKREYAGNILELLRQCGSIFEIVKKETNTPAHFGSFQLMTVL